MSQEKTFGDGPLSGSAELVSGMADPHSPSFTGPPQPDPGPINHVFYPALDGLRAIAFLLVFAHHYIKLPWAFAGMNVFFILSGFLITGILFDTRNKPHRVWNFYMRRSLRIFPLYYGVLLVFLLLDVIFRWQWNAAWLVWPGYVGNLVCFLRPSGSALTSYNLFHANLSSQRYPIVIVFFQIWSLCVEEQFYLVWPWIVFWIKDLRRLMTICAVVFLAVSVFRGFALHVLPTYMIQTRVLYFGTPFRCDSLLLGGMIALAVRAGHKALMLRIARFTYLAFAVFALVMLKVNPGALLHAKGYADTDIVAPVVINLLAAAMLLLALDAGSWTYKMLNPAPLRWIGRISYGAYMLHMIPMVLKRPMQNARLPHVTLLHVLLSLALTLAAAGLSFHFFESPFIRLKDRFSRGRGAGSSNPLASAVEPEVVSAR